MDTLIFENKTLQTNNLKFKNTTAFIKQALNIVANNVIKSVSLFYLALLYKF
jgi:hypothetical protein